MVNKMFMAVLAVTMIQSFAVGYTIGKSQHTKDRLFLEQQTQLLNCLEREIK